LTTMPLSPADRRRLEQFMGMTGSQHDGEATNALRLAQKLAAAAGLSLIEAIRASAAQQLDLVRITALEADAYRRGYERGLEEGAEQDKPRSWPALAHHFLTGHAPLLNEWERGFCSDFITKRWAAPTPKQRAIFERIATRCGVPTP
jgi:hypothetical protein